MAWTLLKHCTTWITAMNYYNTSNKSWPGDFKACFVCYNVTDIVAGLAIWGDYETTIVKEYSTVYSPVTLFKRFRYLLHTNCTVSADTAETRYEISVTSDTPTA